MLKIAFATVCTDGYVKYLEVFLKSILINNPGFNIPFYVISRCELLSEENCEKLLSIYGEIVFKYVNPEIYIRNGKGNVRFYSVETFNISGYDKLIYFGSDVLCLGDITELYKIKIKDKNLVAMTREIRRINTYNNNCMIIKGDLACPEIHNELLTTKHDLTHAQYGTDQKLYSIFFKNKIQDLDYKWNVLVSEVTEADIDFNEIKFLHYIYKPDFEEGMKMLQPKLIDLWNEYRGRAL